MFSLKKEVILKTGSRNGGGVRVCGLGLAWVGV